MTIDAGRNALHLAAEAKRENVLRYLLQQGANPVVSNYYIKHTMHSYLYQDKGTFITYLEGSMMILRGKGGGGEEYHLKIIIIIIIFILC